MYILYLHLNLYLCRSYIYIYEKNIHRYIYIYIYILCIYLDMYIYICVCVSCICIVYIYIVTNIHLEDNFFSKISILTLRTLCLRIFPTLRTLHLEHMIKNPPNVLSVGPVQPNDDTYIYI